MTDWLSREDFAVARRRVAGAVHRTPLLSFRTLGRSSGTDPWLKCENLQKTGSFKVRGALNAIATLSRRERARGVITISAGNHAQAVAWAAGRAGARAVVVMPEGAARTKVEAAAGYGAEVHLHGDAAAAFREAHRRAAEEKLVFLHPFDAAPVIAGHGSTGLEVAEDIPGEAVMVVPVGGGGQIAGIAGALAASGRLTGRGRVRVVGVEPEGAPGMRRSLDEGRAATLDGTRTIADGLAPPMAGELNYRYVAEFAEDVVLVSDEEILSAMRLLLTRAKLVAEPSGAAAVAALMFGRVSVATGETVVALVSGGNVDDGMVVRALREGVPWP
ncbi:MAG: pyridoxal-phosphate dependent enzyme [Gemmatimonadota bacterium]|nr:pyridoxal-phosphate dependent enzyme [Gemmatimonadota bacterium]MDE2983771.1 pyridoxal-phosphate dependent enzyme [Gemmatimonadota bacterium]